MIKQLTAYWPAIEKLRTFRLRIFPLITTGPVNIPLLAVLNVYIPRQASSRRPLPLLLSCKINRSLH